jgi:AraC family transcriptional regulator
VKQSVTNTTADLSFAVSATAPGPARIIQSSSSGAWQGILLEKHISSPGERKPASIDHNVISLLCSNAARGELLSSSAAYGELLCSPLSNGERQPGRGDVPYVIPRGALAIYPPGPVLGVSLDTTCELLHCALEKEFIRGVREEMGIPQPDALVTRKGLFDNTIARLLILLAQELEAGAPSGKLYADSLIQALAVRLVLLDGKPSSGSSAQVSPLPRRVLRRVKERIDAEPTGDLSLSMLAEVSGYSPRHFHRMFRAATGLTPYQYMLERRIGRAQELLEKRNLRLIDIAASCGFSSHSHMTTIFRKLIGMTPGEYRRHSAGSRILPRL